MTPKNKTVSIKETFNLVLDYLDNEGDKSVTTNLKKGDSIQIWDTDLYFRKKNLIVLTGKRSRGKTSLALSMLRNIALDSKRAVCFISCDEQDNNSVTLNLLAQESEIALHKIRSAEFTKDDVSKIENATARLYNAPIFLHANSKPAYEELEAEIRNMVQNLNVEVVFIDNPELTNGLSIVNKIPSWEFANPIIEELYKIFESLKKLAEELNISIVFISALAESPRVLNRVENNDDIDMVLLLEREFNKDETVDAELCKLIIYKDTVYDGREIILLFELNCTKFEYVEKKLSPMNIEENETIKSLLTQIKEEDRENALLMINESIGNTEHEVCIGLEIEDYENCFTKDKEVHYLEFNTESDARKYFSKQNGLSKLVVLVSDNEELTMEEIGKACKAILINTPQQNDYSLMWSYCCNSSAKFLRMLVQLNK